MIKSLNSSKAVAKIYAITLTAILIAAIVTVSAYYAYQGGFSAQSPRSTISPSPIVSSSPTPSSTEVSPSSPPTQLPTPTLFPTNTPYPTLQTASPSSTVLIPTPTPIASPTSTSTSAPSPTPTPQLTPSSTPTPTLSPTPVPTPSPTPSPTSTPTPMPTPQPSATPPVLTSAQNWAGFVVASDLQNPQPMIIGVSASWIVPVITPSGLNAFSSIWIGIGGEFDQSLIQTGTEHDSLGGLTQYSAWYEMLPNLSTPIDTIDVSPGDLIEASIQLVDSNTNLWAISLSDVTKGQSFQNNFTYNSGRLSAEWIVERPELTTTGSLTYLANFGNITFTDCRVVFQDKSGAISDFPSTEVVMDAQLRGGQFLQLVDVSALSDLGTKFTVTFLNA